MFRCDAAPPWYGSDAPAAARALDAVGPCQHCEEQDGKKGRAGRKPTKPATDANRTRSSARIILYRVVYQVLLAP